MSRNLFAQFRKLIPSAPLQAGTVVAVDGGVATVELPGGALITARGEAAISDVVFVRDGAIEGAAGILPLELIEV